MATAVTSIRSAEQGRAVGAREAARARWPDWVCLGVYACLLAIMIPRHEPWSDEAQAWMLARSLSLWDIFHTYLHYEGAPGLWYVLLWVLVKLHAGYAGMHWVAGAIAACGVWVFVRNAPFPWWLKYSAPFSYFIAYQYAVVARNYVLAPLLLFAVAAVWKRNPIWIAVLLGLLGNVSGHTMAIAMGFAMAFGIELKRTGTQGGANPKRRDLWIALGVLTVLFAIAAYTASPAPDVWVGAYHPAGAVMQTPVERAITRVLQCAARSWQPWILGFVGWPLIFKGLRDRRALHFALPMVFCFLFSAVYVGMWHVGLAVPALLASLWITWPSEGAPLSWGEKTMRWTVGVLMATGLIWTARAVVYDYCSDYSPDAKTAQFLKPIVDGGGKVAVGWLRDSGSQLFHAVGLAPYFPGKLFMNQVTPFYPKNMHDRTEADFPETLQQHPQAVVLEFVAMDGIAHYEAARDLATPNAMLAERSGYGLSRVFCGTRVEGPRPEGEICHLIFLPQTGSAR